MLTLHTVVFGFISGAFENNFPLGSAVFPSKVTVHVGDYSPYTMCKDFPGMADFVYETLEAVTTKDNVRGWFRHYL